MKRTVPLLIFACIFLGMAWYAVSQLLQQLREYRAGETSYNALAQYAQLSETAPGQSQLPEGTPDLEETAPLNQEDGTVWPVVDFGALQAVNPDVVAWIYLEGTNINYPIVRGADNAEYLDKLVDGTYNSAGSIFMDYRNGPDFSDCHTVLYGHHMKNQTMFSQITGYKTQSFYEEHPTCLLLTPQGNYKLAFFAGYTANLNGDAWKLSFESAQEYAAWLEAAVARSDFRSSVTPTAQDLTVTLSTCTYEYDNARYVLLGVLCPG